MARGGRVVVASRYPYSGNDGSATDRQRIDAGRLVTGPNRIVAESAKPNRFVVAVRRI